MAELRNLIVTGATSLSGSLSVVGNTTVGGTLVVTSNTTVGGTLNVTSLATLNGGIRFPDISSGNSQGISWAGSTDNAKIYYKVESSDKGTLMLDIGDDYNATIGFAHNGDIKSRIDANGNFSGTAANATNATNDSDGSTINSTYLKKSGGTMTGSLTFANNTWNVVGDDCAIGDHNIAGAVAICGQNGTTKLDFCQYGAPATYKSLSYDGNYIYLDGVVKYQHTNEINFSGGTQGNVWFNYRNADTQNASGSNIATTYFFGNYNKGTASTTLKADKFTGAAETAYNVPTSSGYGNIWIS